MDSRATEKETDGSDERFVRRVAAMLDSSVETLPPHIEARLDSMRSTALTRVSEHAVFVQSAESILSGEEHVDGLPIAVRERLDGIRAQALQRAALTLEARSSSTGSRLAVSPQWAARLFGPGLKVPAGAFASVCVLVTTLAVFTVRDAEDVIPPAMSEEGLVLASAEEIELYENLEFYQWLAENGL
ncbi:MAG: DUF3619 family protein [Pseudomonadota bacterium]